MENPNVIEMVPMRSGATTDSQDGIESNKKAIQAVLAGAGHVKGHE